MEIIKIILRALWRVWFYVTAGFIIIILLPVLMVLTSNDQFYPYFFKLARWWAKVVLFLMGFKVKVQGNQKFEEGKSYMFSANHTSMIDVFVMLAVVKNPFVFVGKYELVKLPVFGFFYKRTCILVDRSDPESRKNVYQSAQRKLKRGFSVCIFPEGLVPKDENIVLSEFKNGVFSLSIEHQIPIVPMAFYDCKKRFSYTITSGSPGILRVKILDIIETQNLTLNDKNRIREKAFNMMYQELITDLENQQLKQNEKQTHQIL
ncbi:MAG: lysophospholipid acyltransferase family protein [Flavobacteriaceae bacterium]|nr:lysophospholipid acyltransferase family protein [Flavobacteriaceae bacterium]